MSRLARGEVPFWQGSLHDDAPHYPQVTYKPREVFVLMEMTTEDSGPVYSAIKAACHAINLVAIRADEKAGAGLIMKDVDTLMGRAEFLVFDLTKERPNVYYELGYAHGIGNNATNILLVAREGTVIAFDVAPLRVHFYRSLEHLQSMVSAQLGELKRTTRAARESLGQTESPKRPWWKIW